MMRRAAVSAPSSPTDAAAFAAARQRCREHGGSAGATLGFLPQPKRDAASALCAFAQMTREAMTAADPGDEARAMTAVPEAASCGAGDARLQMFRDRVAEIYGGRVELPLPEFRSPDQHILHGVSLTVRRHQVPQDLLLTLAEGWRHDAGVRRYATWKALREHCHRTGGPIGAMLVAVLGATHSDAASFAADLGAAARFTGILCHVGAHARSGRIYLPQEDLARFRNGERELVAGIANDRFAELMRFEAGRARDLFRSAAEGICWLADHKSMFAVAMAVMFWCSLLSEIERRPQDVLGGGIRLTTMQKLGCSIAAWRLARRRPGRPLPDVFR